MRRAILAGVACGVIGFAAGRLPPVIPAGAAPAQPLTITADQAAEISRRTTPLLHEQLDLQRQIIEQQRAMIAEILDALGREPLESEQPDKI